MIEQALIGLTLAGGAYCLRTLFNSKVTTATKAVAVTGTAISALALWATYAVNGAGPGGLALLPVLFGAPVLTSTAAAFCLGSAHAAHAGSKTSPAPAA